MQLRLVLEHVLDLKMRCKGWVSEQALWFLMPTTHHQKWFASKPAAAIPTREEKGFLKGEDFV